LGLEHHLVVWGNYLITSAGLVVSYEYLIHSGTFIPNPYPDVTFASGYYGICQSATTMFICIIFIFIFMGLFIFRSSPWKEPLYQNKPLTVLLILNFVAVLFLFFGTKYLSFLNIVPLETRIAGVIFAIMVATMTLLWMFNVLI
jgi:hypothetical protein